MLVRKVSEKDYAESIEKVHVWIASIQSRSISQLVRSFFVKDFFSQDLNKFLARQVAYSLQIHEKKHVYFYGRQFFECCQDQKTLALAVIEEDERFIDMIYLCISPEKVSDESNFKIVYELVSRIFHKADQNNKKIRFSPLLEELDMNRFLNDRERSSCFSVQ